MSFWLDRVALGIGAAGGVGIAAMFAYIVVAHPSIHWAIGVAPAIVFMALGLYSGYRACAPTAWFLNRDRKAEEWCARHPVLSAICVLVTLVHFVKELLEFLEHLFP